MSTGGSLKKVYIFALSSCFRKRKRKPQTKKKIEFKFAYDFQINLLKKLQAVSSFVTVDRNLAPIGGECQHNPELRKVWEGGGQVSVSGFRGWLWGRPNLVSITVLNPPASLPLVECFWHAEATETQCWQVLPQAAKALGLRLAQNAWEWDGFFLTQTLCRSIRLNSQGLKRGTEVGLF